MKKLDFTGNSSSMRFFIIFIMMAIVIFGPSRVLFVEVQHAQNTVKSPIEPSPAQTAPNVTTRQSATASIEHLARVMDEYHNNVIVYSDISSGGNHFHVRAKVPDGNAPVTIYGSSTNNPRSGATAIRNQLCPGGGPYGGYYFQNGILPNGASAPQANFGDVPNAGIDLTGAARLTFWARGEVGNEKVEFFMGGVGRDAVTGNPTAPFPDSTPRRPALGTLFTLSTSWQQFAIDLTGANLSYVLGGFGWVATIANNPSGVVFYLDDLQFELNDAARAQRLNQPRFLRSYTTEPSQSQAAPVNDFDLRFRNTAFTYDNALALLAFLADGTEDSLRRAELIGKAFANAATHDRFYNDGRLRNAYSSGDLSLPPGWTPNGRIGTAAIPGFYTETQPACFTTPSPPTFTEIGQESIDTGNNFWAGIAMAALYRRVPNADYLTAANNLGAFIQTFRNTVGTYQGFQGGFENPESANPTRRIYASSEHNLDGYAFFAALNKLTGQPQWQTDAQHARQFVDAMWDSQRNCYLTGSNDPSARNTTPGQLPLDVQAWSVLALPDTLSLHPQVLNCAEQNHRVTHHTFAGYDFNEDRDGVWFEGTAQMATAYTFSTQQTLRENILTELRRAQQTPPAPAVGDMGGLVAACHNGVSTGFGFSYFLRLHIAATAWNVFAQLGVNPYYLLSKTAFDFDGDRKTDLSIFRPSVGEWWYLRSSDGQNYAAQFGASSDKITPADFTGDGKTDIAFWRPSNGFWFVLRSEDNSFYSFPFGTSGDIPAPADYDGDGKADAAVFRPSAGIWYIFRSSGGTTIQQFGQNGDVPVASDYDGDGKADIAIYRVALGEWWIERSAAGLIAFQFGNSADKPVQGDYTGDGKSDGAIFRPSTGEWFVLRSEDQSYYSFPFGTSGDIPAPGDYDGDGKFDASVFRPSISTWFVQRTTAGTLIQTFGIAGDKPVPNAFVP